MDFDKLPNRFRRERTCAMCKSKMDLFEVYLDEDRDEPGVVTNFKCPKCENTHGIIYTGKFIDTYKESQEAQKDIHT